MNINIKSPELPFSWNALIWFLGISFGTVTVICAIIYFGNIPMAGVAYFSLYGLGLLSPFAASLAYSWITTKSFTPIRNMYSNLHLGRSAVIVIVIPASLIISYLVGSMMGYPVDFTQLDPILSLLIGISLWCSVMWAEETGWRGILLPVLQSRYSPFKATSWVAITWIAWHIPFLVLIGIDELGFVLFTLQTFGLALAMTWAYNQSGSVIVAVLIHGFFNGTALWATTAAPSMTDLELMPLQAAGPFVLGMIILLATKGKLGLSHINPSKSSEDIYRFETRVGAQEKQEIEHIILR